MTLGEKRRQFSKMLCLLLHYIEFLGLDYAVDYVKRCDSCPVGHPNSVHKAALAADVLIYAPGGVYPHPSAASIYSKLHDFWDHIGGAKRIDGDLNHFSLSHNGVR